MRLGLFCVTVGMMMPAVCMAQAKPPAVSWEWFNAAEAYRHYPGKSAANMVIAAHYYRMAADHGNAPAAYKLGEMYENGEGLAKNAMTAFGWYRKAAEAGDQYGQFRVGWFFQKGLAMPTDPVEAARWYRLSAAQGNVWALHMLAFMLADGEGMPKDEKLARSYFELSLPRTQDHWAQWKLALLIQSEDPVRARSLLRQSAAAGNPEALKALQASGN